MIPFPTEFPIDALKLLSGFILHKAPTTLEACNAGWNVLGYAGHMALDSSKPALVGATDCSHEDKEAFFKHCELVAADPSHLAGFAIPPWLITAVINMVINYLQKKV